MIRVSKIAHASYETPDLDQQIEYYTEIMGLTLAAKEKDAAYLASTVDHHSVVLRRGPQAQCLRLGFQIADDADLGEFEKQVAAHGVKTQRKKDPEPSISRDGHFRRSEGHDHRSVQARRILAPEIPEQGHRAAQARPRRLSRHRRQAGHQVLLRRARLSRIRLDGGLFLDSCAAAPTTTPSI